MYSATKVRLYPTEEQRQALEKQFGAVRFVYNKALHLRSHVYKYHGVSLNNRKDIQPLLPVAKKSRRYAWIANADSHALQVSLQNLDRAFVNFFQKRARYPRFKSKHGKQSSYHCSSLKVTAESIKIPKISAIKAKIHREISGAIKNITIIRSATGKYYASILSEKPETAPEKPTKIATVTGLDMGLSHFAIQSDGHKVANPRPLLRNSRNLRRKQKALSRKQKGSANRAKARLQVAKCHEHVANTRADFQHKLSRTLVDENQAIIVETLKIKNMMKNHQLARAIGDASWHSFINKLAYKAEQKGVHLVRLEQGFASSKLCHCCGYRMPDMPLRQRLWSCPECGTAHDRDINAALNIRHKGILALQAAGHVVSAHGGLRKSVVPTVAA
ncbi:RNA-guided endonuclease InsQ/TnpB family protein [Xenorhabdus griffiniae]|uniref:Transposase n=1 Tax=Xenorhabdus griffiniae TaxID=351672 RepID=A0ABY9XN30_9GAMM|nr:RNA-guided endonuclease TnpB family protein [Xenorhabdus griffiniae]MBD1227987.1 IS200/IS605 family element transposase accessory protein TnpB [Xenorhabdus griffiniae]MBE8587412.1 transposase [Xenorhabdus griffiniae]WMV74354.1 transposase [Xenorhabdus griffiniae]WNH04034.1 transposase [Xenorhabdus griffiniae]